MLKSCITSKYISNKEITTVGHHYSQRVLSVRFVLSLRYKILNVKNFVIKLRQSLWLDKMGFTKGLRQNFVLSFVLTSRPLQGRLKSFLKYSIACILHFTLCYANKKYTMGIYTSYKSNLHHLITCKYPHFTFLW